MKRRTRVTPSPVGAQDDFWSRLLQSGDGASTSVTFTDIHRRHSRGRGCYGLGRSSRLLVTEEERPEAEELDREPRLATGVSHNERRVLRRQHVQVRSPTRTICGTQHRNQGPVQRSQMARVPVVSKNAARSMCNQ